MDAIDHILTRGVDKIYPSREALEKILRSGKKLKLYQGFDPSGTHLHIGHAVAMRKLRQFQELGHHVIFLIGDFTGMIGDPTDKLATRKKLSREQVLANAQLYKQQAGKVLRFDGNNPVEIKFNSAWLDQLKFADVLELASFFTVQQLIERDMFQKRVKESKEISLVEFLYPMMVAYDAVTMEVDLELGGSDQTFNMLAGRKMHEHILHKEKFVMTVPLLTDAKGTKIGKTEGNVIGLTDEPNEFFGKIMALGDDAIIPCFTLLTDIPLLQIEQIKRSIENGQNPIKFKLNLAFELTKQFNSEKEAIKAKDEFTNIFINKKQPTWNVPSVMINGTKWNIINLLLTTGLSKSKSEAKRLISQGAVELNAQVIKSITDNLIIRDDDIIRVGKTKFTRVKTV